MPTAASIFSFCLCASEEQFILSQVALLEQVNALMPVLDSASIKGTPLGLQLRSHAWGSDWWGQGLPVLVLDLLPVVSCPVGAHHLTVVKIPT